MKKFLSAAVAFGLVAGVAATASALELKVKGNYNVDGYWIDAYAGMASDTGVDGDWYQHTFRLNADLIVNDKITVKSDIRLVDSNSVWGGGLYGFDKMTDNGGNLDINKLWLVYDSPIGKWEIGRRPGGAWGPDFVSSSTNADRIFWHLPTGDGPFKAYTFLEKIDENDLGGPADSDGPLVSGFNGADNDYYEVGAGYKTEAVTVYGGLGTRQNDSTETELWRVKSWGQFATGPVDLVYELDYKFGEANPLVDYDSWAFMFAATGSAGNVSWMAGYWTITGDNNPLDDENNAYDANHGTGDDFEPLYILTGNRTNVLNGDLYGNVSNPLRQAGVHAVVATADFKASEDLTLHGGIGWAMADEEMPGWDDEYGWEVDAGLAYKLYQNLTYELHFGYWFVGDFAEGFTGPGMTDDVMLLSHHLSMKF